MDSIPSVGRHVGMALVVLLLREALPHVHCHLKPCHAVGTLWRDRVEGRGVTHLSQIPTFLPALLHYLAEDFAFTGKCKNIFYEMSKIKKKRKERIGRKAIAELGKKDS